MVGALTRVLMNLINKHGLSRGIRLAQRLGFDNKSIKQAFKATNRQDLSDPRVIKAMRDIQEKTPF